MAGVGGVVPPAVVAPPVVVAPPAAPAPAPIAAQGAQFAAVFGANLPANRAIGTSLEHEVTMRVNELTNVWGLDDNSTGLVAIGLLTRIYTMSTANGANLTGVRRTVGSPAALFWAQATAIGNITSGAADIDAAAPATILQDAASNLFRRMITSYETAPRWIAELCAAHQTRALSPENVANYFMGIGIERVNGNAILKIIGPIAGMMPRIMADAVTRGMLDQSDWMRYHTTATSTPVLVQKAIDFVGNAIPGFWNPATTAAVTNALREPWNKNLADLIPRKAVAATHAILYSLKQCPSDWYQGKKAKQATPASNYNAWLAFATRLQELVINAAAIENAATFQALTAAVPAACLNC